MGRSNCHRSSKLPQFHYEILGMKELYIDYGGVKPAQHPIHKELGRLTPGDALQLVKRKGQLELISQGITVARLAKTAGKRWQSKLQAIKSVKIIAISTRHRADIKDNTFENRCQMESWELPIVEIRVVKGGRI